MLMLSVVSVSARQIKSELNVITLTLSAKVVEPEAVEVGRSELSTPSAATPQAGGSAFAHLDGASSPTRSNLGRRAGGAPTSADFDLDPNKTLGEQLGKPEPEPEDRL